MTKAGERLTGNALCEDVNNVRYVTASGDGKFDPATGVRTIYFPVQGTVDFYDYYPYTAV